MERLIDGFARVLEKSPKITTLENHEPIIREDDRAGKLVIITNGFALPYHTATEGRFAGFPLAGPNTILGTEVFDGSLYYEMSAHALGDCEVADIPVDLFLRTISLKPDLMRQVLKQVSRQIRRAQKALGSAASFSSETKVAKSLLRFDRTKTLPFVNRTDLAISSGFSVAGISRISTKLRRQGLITTDNSAGNEYPLQITDSGRHALKQMAK